MKKLACSLFIALGLFAGTATADERPNFYFGVTGGVTNSDVTEKGFTYSSTTKNERSTSGIKLFAGYSWGVFGIELGQYDLGKYNIEGIANSQPSADEYGVKAFTLSGAAAFPLDRNWDFTTKLGIASGTVTYQCVKNCAGISNQTTNSIGAIFGLGLRWKISRNLAARLDWESIGGLTSKFGSYEEKVTTGLFSAGIEARF